MSMSMLSRCTIGAMASKKASESAPVRAWIAAASAGAVSGPVAMMAWSHSAGGSPVDLLANDGDQRVSSEIAVTASEKPSRSTASAPPAGTWLRSARP
jgi:chemotaxis methyl-accepting protein methylase